MNLPENFSEYEELLLDAARKWHSALAKGGPHSAVLQKFGRVDTYPGFSFGQLFPRLERLVESWDSRLFFIPAGEGVAIVVSSEPELGEEVLENLP